MICYTYDARPWTLNSERQGSTHWTTTRKMTVEWRTAFFWLARSKPVKFDAVNIEVDVNMRYPVADTGACFPAVKAAIDGLVDAGILPDDTPDHVLSILFRAPRRVTKDQRESLTLTLRDPKDGL